MTEADVRDVFDCAVAAHCGTGPGRPEQGASHKILSSEAILKTELICCPDCRGDLGEHACLDCARPFRRSGAQWLFSDQAIDTEDAAFQAETFSGSSFRGRLFNAGKALISSEYQPVPHLERFLASVKPGEVVVELGSGARRLGPEVLNVDLFPFPSVDVAADITRTPIRDSVADYVILDSVIEHVPDPIAVTAEAMRVLKPGGKLFVNCPFMLPYHGYPAHYQNYTKDGLEHLLRGFSHLTVRPTFGPMTAWVNMTAETFAVMVGGERGLGYVIAKGLALLPIFWLKFLDRFTVGADRAHRVSGMLCAIATK